MKIILKLILLTTLIGCAQGPEIKAVNPGDVIPSNFGSISKEEDRERRARESRKNLVH